ncbi:MAG: polyferredoxin [Flavobacteriaceae bacterium]|jgi:polyferredoxin
MVAKTNDIMSDTIDSNLSVAGDAAQNLSLRTKINWTIITIGLLLIGWGLYDGEEKWSYQKIAGFSLTFIGAGLFQYRKWYHNIGSLLFVGGLIGMYYGYSESGDVKYHWLMISFTVMLVGSGFFTFDPDKKNYFGSQFQKSNTKGQKLGMVIALLGFAIIGLSWLAAAFAPAENETASAIYTFLIMFSENAGLFLPISLIMMAAGILIYTYGAYAGSPSGIKNNYVMFNSLSSRGVIGWIVGIILTLFYIQLYWHAEPLANAIDLFDPLSNLLRGKDADQWFLYGTMYTMVILFLGIKFIIKYRHNRYHLIRTIVVILSQLILAYFIPYIMEALSYDNATVLVDGKETYGGYYSANPINTWPLNKDAFSPGALKAYTQEAYQPVGLGYLFWGILMFLVVTPVVTYFVGKRWYCSWFCGCGGLAETAGDSFRHLSNKTVKAWKIERWVLHSVMVFVLLSTIASLWPYLTDKEYAIGFGTINKDSYYFFVSFLLLAGAAALLVIRVKKFKKNRYLLAGAILFLFAFVMLTMSYFGGTDDVFLIQSTSIKKAYGFFVGSAFSGVIGVGFYPILGNRVWCRFGCPMAGYMGIFQRFKSKFRITTNGAQCISCGNCSTYCEQGIDVRAYAQKGENIVRASCVGCGVCSSVCPRGVLKLENGPEEGRFEPNPLTFTDDGIKLNV